MALFNVLAILSLLLALQSCTTVKKQPSNVTDICEIFKEKRSWKKWAKRAYKKYGTPPYIALAFINQESSFKSHARPPPRTFFGIKIGRRSSAFGYSQAKTDTWEWYKEKANVKNVRRTSFKDSVYFIGWYNQMSYELNNIALNDTFNLYLAYHEGHGGHSNGTFMSKKWLLAVAKKVERLANTYQRQMRRCR